jgi:hypothetical protein
MNQLIKSIKVLFYFTAILSLFESCNPDPLLSPAQVEAKLKRIIEELTRQKRDSLDSLIRKMPLLPTIAPIPPTPVGSTSVESGNPDTLYCQLQKMTLAAGDENNLLLEDNGIISLGQLFESSSTLEGNPRPIIVPRRPMVFSTSLTNTQGSPKDTIYNPSSPSSYQESVSRLFKRGIIGKVPAIMAYEIKEVYSLEQLSVALGLDAHGWGAKISGQFSWNNKKIKQRFIVKFYQKFCDLTVDPPKNPNEIFDSLPKPMSLGTYSPVYVSNVKYGRIVLFLWETELEDTDIKASLTASYNALVAGGSITSDVKFREYMKKSTTQVSVFGGDPDEASKVKTPETLQRFIENSANFTPESQGVMMGYTLRFLRDNTVAKIVKTTEYTIRSCQVVPERIYELGTVGGSGGSPFEFRLPADAKLLSIQVNAGDYVDGLTFRYLLNNGEIKSEHFGGNGGGFHPTVSLENLKLTGISGRYGRVIDKLKLHYSDGTISQEYGGGGGDNDFSFQVSKKGDEIFGVFGRNGRLIDALGVICKGR